MTATDGQKIAAIVDGFGLTISPARVLVVLIDSAGRTVDIETLAQRIRDMSGDYPSLDAIKSAVTRVRRRLRDIKSGGHIVTVYGVGYRLEQK
jgi:DNA-binding response OmpR family regulator